jgi:hypothetical protein
MLSVPPPGYAVGDDGASAVASYDLLLPSLTGSLNH